MRLGYFLIRIIIGVCAVWVVAAQAQKAGDILIGAGWLHLSPQVSSDPLLVNAQLGPLPITMQQPGSGATVGDADTIGFTGSYFFTDHFSVEGIVGVPPDFDIYGAGTLAGFGKIGKATQWSPTVLLRYHFRSADKRFRPYIGVGASYVWFSDVKLTNTIGFPSIVTYGPNDTSVSADSAWAPVFNAGFTYRMSKHWFAGFSASYMLLDTTVHLKGGSQDWPASAHITLNPLVTYLNLTYRF